MANLTNLSFENFYESFTEDASVLFLSWCKKVKNDQKLKSRGSCLKIGHEPIPLHFSDFPMFCFCRFFKLPIFRSFRTFRITSGLFWFCNCFSNFSGFFLCIITRSSSFFDVFWWFYDSLGFMIFYGFSFFLLSPNFMLVLSLPPCLPPSTSTYPLTSANFSAPKLYSVQPPFFPGPSGPHFYPRFWVFCSLSTWGSAETLTVKLGVVPWKREVVSVLTQLSLSRGYWAPFFVGRHRNFLIPVIFLHKSSL